MGAKGDVIPLVSEKNSKDDENSKINKSSKRNSELSEISAGTDDQNAISMLKEKELDKDLKAFLAAEGLDLDDQEAQDLMFLDEVAKNMKTGADSSNSSSSGDLGLLGPLGLIAGAMASAGSKSSKKSDNDSKKAADDKKSGHDKKANKSLSTDKKEIEIDFSDIFGAMSQGKTDPEDIFQAIMKKQLEEATKAHSSTSSATNPAPVASSSTANNAGTNAGNNNTELHKTSTSTSSQAMAENLFGSSFSQLLGGGGMFMPGGSRSRYTKMIEDIKNPQKQFAALHEF